MLDLAVRAARSAAAVIRQAAASPDALEVRAKRPNDFVQDQAQVMPFDIRQKRRQPLFPVDDLFDPFLAVSRGVKAEPFRQLPVHEPILSRDPTDA